MMVPKNKFQSHLRRAEHETLKGGWAEEHLVGAQIFKVFDGETQDREEVPPYIKRELERYPGKVFALVKTKGSNQFLLLPFKDPMEHIYATYGNAKSLEARDIKVAYKGNRVDLGRIVLDDDYQSRSLNIPVASETYDIGGIV